MLEILFKDLLAARQRIRRLLPEGVQWDVSSFRRHSELLLKLSIYTDGILVKRPHIVPLVVNLAYLWTMADQIEQRVGTAPLRFVICEVRPRSPK